MSIRLCPSGLARERGPQESGPSSTQSSAYYYAASLVAGVLSYAAIALTYALYAAGVREKQSLAPLLRFTLRLAFTVVIAANVVLNLGAPLILRVFGSQYSAHGATVLRLLGAAILMMVIKDHYIAISRIRGTVLAAAVLCAAGSALEIGLAATGGIYGGLTWLVVGQLAALALETIVMAPTLIRELGWVSQSQRRTPSRQHRS